MLMLSLIFKVSTTNIGNDSIACKSEYVHHHNETNEVLGNSEVTRYVYMIQLSLQLLNYTLFKEKGTFSGSAPWRKTETSKKTVLTISYFVS